MGAEANAVPRPFDATATVPILRADVDPAPAEALELDRVIHERVRLGIVSLLAVHGTLFFTDIRDLLGITDGNLITHTRRLEEAGYLLSSKSGEGRSSTTSFALTDTGRRELQGYLDHMEAIIRATRSEGEG
jgi:DNA-binding MarR family transcriptional regulator